jgi:hypothetical protein
MNNPQFARRAPASDFSDSRRQPFPALPARPSDAALFSPANALGVDCVRALYFSLSKPQPDAGTLDAARRFLDASVQDVALMESDLPASASELEDWINRNTADVGMRYQSYLAARKAGGPRQYFSNKSHALYFLKSVAPTKTVDGAWLYGLVRHWNDGRFGSLIRIYLEELGSGMPDKNHVLLYKKLLAVHGCDKWDQLSETHFVQGAIQLALAHQADHFLPELIGFNLGYEQLPLHLLIAAYELNELGIDPYYFTLHVTVDNADTGHAKTALNGLREAWPVVGDGARFYERVINGYKLNMLGAGTNSVIDGFDLKQELIAILAEKSAVGKQVHSDYCRVAGRPINDWLSDPAEIPAFLEALEQAGWIRRHEAPENSRFWKLIQGERAEMFGVFSAYEQQVIHDWILGDAAGAGAAGAVATAADKPGQRMLSFKARQKLLETLARRGVQEPAQPSVAGQAPQLHAVDGRADDSASDFDQDLRQLDLALARTSNRDEAMDLLASLLSPARHHTAVGLKATRLFTRMLG